MVYSWCILMSTEVWPKWPCFYMYMSHEIVVGTGCSLGRALMSLKVIYFQSIFMIDFYLKRLIYVQKYGITHQTAIQ